MPEDFGARFSFRPDDAIDSDPRHLCGRATRVYYSVKKKRVGRSQ